MALKNQEGERLVFTSKDGEKVYETKRPQDMDLRLRIQEERDFLIAEALKNGRGDETFKITNLPDEHFKRIIEDKKKISRNK
ncbi:MAG: hypothetical protein Q7K65_00905 [Candidatus Buchananbacteria bacterium]|nr:hypothetical protein [Candidatus Buchananbacteria bacterium]